MSATEPVHTGGGPVARTRATQPAFRPDIQGLRAVAILSVVLYHAGVPLLRGGFVGVDVFFVISGFLITQVLWKDAERRGRISFAGFYARRVRRLLPASVLVLAVTLVASALLLPPLRLAGVARDVAAAAFYGANYRFAVQGTDYLAGSTPPSPVQHFWSLGVEEQFYLLYPLLLLAVLAFCSRRRRRATAAATLAVLGLASLALEIWLTRANQPWAFYALPPRAWELAAGGVLALALPWLARLPARFPRAASDLVVVTLGWVGLSAVLLAAVAYGSGTTYPGVAALVPVAGTVAVIAAGSVSTARGPAFLLRRRPMQGIGAVSYSWYLWHWPVLVLGGTRWAGPEARGGLVLLSAVLAWATLHVLENPVRQAPLLVRSPWRSLGLGATLTGVALATTVLVTGLVPAPTGSAPAAAAPRLQAPAAAAKGQPIASRLDTIERPVLAAVTQAASTRAVPANLTPSLSRAHADKATPFLDGCDLSFTVSVSPPCIYGDPSASTRVVTFGDSHAAQWFPALDQAAIQHHWRLENLTKATCPPMRIGIYSPVLARNFRECEQWRESALSRIAAEKPALVVVDMARHYGPEYGFAVDGPEWISDLGDLVRLLRRQGSQVVVLGPTPKPPGDAPECLSAHLDDVSACTAPLSTAVNVPGAGRERRAVTGAGGSYVDVAPWICSPTRCAVVLGNLLIFRDDNHVTTDFARWLTPVLTTVVQDTLPRSRPH